MSKTLRCSLWKTHSKTYLIICSRSLFHRSCHRSCSGNLSLYKASHEFGKFVLEKLFWKYRKNSDQKSCFKNLFWKISGTGDLEIMGVHSTENGKLFCSAAMENWRTQMLKCKFIFLYSEVLKKDKNLEENLSSFLIIGRDRKLNWLYKCNTNQSCSCSHEETNTDTNTVTKDCQGWILRRIWKIQESQKRMSLLSHQTEVLWIH